MNYACTIGCHKSATSKAPNGTHVFFCFMSKQMFFHLTKKSDTESKRASETASKMQRYKCRVEINKDYPSSNLS